MESNARWLRTAVWLTLATMILGVTANLLLIRVDATTSSMASVQRDALTDRWYAEDGIEHSITTWPLPDEPVAAHFARHQARALLLKESYPPRSMR